MRQLALSLILLALVLMNGTHPAAAQSVEDVREAIQKEQGKADQRQGRIENLESREAKLKRQLATTEREIRELQEDIAQREEALVDIEAREAQARVDYRTLQGYHDKLVAELRQLISALWPIHNQRATDRLRGLHSWQEADRRFTWMAAIYRATEERLREAQQTAERMAANLEEQARLASEAAEQLAQVNSAKDQMLRKRLSLRRNIRSTEAAITDLEKELTSILGVIKDLNYKLKTQRTKHFKDNKKLLPWPAPGSVASTFAPSAKPPRRGIGIATSGEVPVKSVFWGKVVHADVVRGFGRVVIVYHGHDYYSVYAYLSGSLVEPGQEVEKDEPIGQAGFDPRTHHAGLYFELRSGAKPINPMKWLIPK